MKDLIFEHYVRKKMFLSLTPPLMTSFKKFVHELMPAWGGGEGLAWVNFKNSVEQERSFKQGDRTPLPSSGCLGYGSSAILCK